MNPITLLGPQRFEPSVRQTLETFGHTGPVAAVTAGWQERESEDSELADHLGCEVRDLLLYHRADDVRVRDRELAAAWREKQDRLRELQALYRIRLSHAIEAAREMMLRPGGGRLLSNERSSAIRAVRTLDRQHLRRVRAMHDEFERRWEFASRPAVARHRAQIRKVLATVSAVAIAGGHVAVLVNRLRMFGMAELLAGRPLVAWSAGSMALTERVVLFHDSPPQGAGHAEVLDAGLGLAPGIVALPHAQRRLRLEDRTRVALFSRRFSPSLSVVFGTGSRMSYDGTGWQFGRSVRTLGRRGGVRAVA